MGVGFGGVVGVEEFFFDLFVFGDVVSDGE